MPIVKVSAKSRYGFVVNEVRGFVVTAKGVDVDTESKLYTVIQPYITKGILVQEGETVVVKPVELPTEPVTATVPEIPKSAALTTEIPAEVVPVAQPSAKKKKGNKNSAEASEADVTPENTETDAATPAPAVIEPSALSFS